MHYYLYEITNKVNGKIYVGVHKTNDLNDGYMGSGKVIKRAIQKHGAEHFTKVILETFENAEAMYAREKEVITDEFLARDDVYNLRRGGYGGFEYISKNKLNGFCDLNVAKIAREITDKILLEKYGSEWRSLLAKRGSDGYKRRLAVDDELRQKVRDRAKHLTEFTLNDATRQKRKNTFSKINHQSGESNSQFGTCWISHELIGSRKCKKDLLPLYLDQGWYKGRK